MINATEIREHMEVVGSDGGHVGNDAASPTDAPASNAP